MLYWIVRWILLESSRSLGVESPGLLKYTEVDFFGLVMIFDSRYEIILPRVVPGFYFIRSCIHSRIYPNNCNLLSTECITDNALGSRDKTMGNEGTSFLT